MMRLARILCLGACIATLLALAGVREGAPAELVATPTGSPLGMSNSKNGLAVMNATGLQPGGSRSGEVTVTNTGTTDADFALDATNVEDVAGPAGGRLGEVLRLSLDEVSSGADPKSVYSGLAADMPRVLLGEVAQGAARTYRFTVSVPRGEADNSVQGSSMSVDYVWSEQAAAASGVEGTSDEGGDGDEPGSGDAGDVAGSTDSGSSGSGGVSATDGGGLPFTGLPLVAMMLLGGAAIAAGAGLRSRAR